MDHYEILNRIRDKKNVERAFYLTLHDRINTDYYFEYFELEYAYKNRERIIESLIIELEEPEKYSQRPAYAFYPPKSDLCYRRMIYIPFKDLVVRYAYVSVLADILDDELSHQCFANRKAKGERAKKSLLEDFAIKSWPNFCSWQKTCAENYSVLLRTDISAFYDSVSHDYLVALVARELGVQEDTDLMSLFRTILGVPVISYSHLKKETTQPIEIKQGLAIGNSTDGFLANLYLKDVDDAIIKINGIEFGRYNDDMRIFGNDRKAVLDAVLSLQELLLAKGLNLNSGKSKIAENEVEIEKLRSKHYEIYFYHIEEVDVGEVEKVIHKVNHLADEIDVSFADFDRRFSPEDVLDGNRDARDFCKFLHSTSLLPLEERSPDYVSKLGEILREWQGSGKHASWLLIQSAFWRNVPDKSRELSKQIILKALGDDNIDSYSKYRLLHHLLKRRGEQGNRLLQQLSDGEEQIIVDTIPYLLGEPAFELNLIGLYFLHVIGKPIDELKDYVKKYSLKPVGEPIKKAFSYLQEPIVVEVPEDQTIFSPGDEPDEIPQPY